MTEKKHEKTGLSSLDKQFAKVTEPVFVISRTFDAPRELVFSAWTDPAQLMHWWGPEGFNVPLCEIDARPGGAFRIVMNAPDGNDYPLKGFYREVVEPERLVYSENWEEHPKEWHELLRKFGADKTDLGALDVVTFDEREGKTLLTIRTLFPFAEVRDAMLKIGVNESWSQSLDRLADSLRSKKGEAAEGRTRFIAEQGTQTVVLTRTLDAPRERVFKMFTDPCLIQHWWGPKTLTTTVDKMDVKQGGSWRFVQCRQDGKKYVFSGIYHKVSKPELLVFTFEYEGMPGHVLLETVRFEEHEGKTRLTDTSVFQSVEDRLVMLNDGMEEGAVESIDRFAELIATTRAKSPAKK